MTGKRFQGHREGRTPSTCAEDRDEVQSDGELARFREGMDRLERLTRVTCTIVGSLFGILTIYCLLTGWPTGALAFLFPTAICLARGLCRPGSDLEAVRGFHVLGFLRWTFPLGWWHRRRW